MIDLDTAFSAATIHEAAARTGALPGSIKPISSGFRLWGPAFPVQTAPGNNLAIHQALYRAAPGDVLVVDVGSATEFGYWGEILSVAAGARGLGGLVIGGGVRDVTALAQLGFPVFAHGVCMVGTVKNVDPRARIGEPVLIGEVVVRRGDLVVGDADGVAVLAASRVDEVLREAEDRERKEADMMARLRAGSTTLELLGLRDAPDLASRDLTAEDRRSVVAEEAR